MKTILYTTDFSEHAQNAFLYAYQLSLKISAELFVLHVFDVPTFFDNPLKSATFFDVEKDTKHLIKDKIQYFCENQLKKGSATEHLRYEARENLSPVNGIVEMIKECNADMVVMGTKGVSILRELLMGSTAMGVIEKASCPVLTIPEDADFKTLKHIVYATDFEPADLTGIKALSDIATLFFAKITVVHIATDNENSTEKKMEHFKNLLEEKSSYHRLKFELIFSNNIYEELNKYVVVNGVSMIVLLERPSENVFDKWFHRDLVNRLETHTTIPLLSFNKKYINKYVEEHKMEEVHSK